MEHQDILRLVLVYWLLGYGVVQYLLREDGCSFDDIERHVRHRAWEKHVETGKSLYASPALHRVVTLVALAIVCLLWPCLLLPGERDE